MVKPRTVLTVAVTFRRCPASGSSLGTASTENTIWEPPSASIGTVNSSTRSIWPSTGRSTGVAGVPFWNRRVGDQPSADTDRSTVTSRVPVALSVRFTEAISPLSTSGSSSSASSSTL